MSSLSIGSQTAIDPNLLSRRPDGAEGAQKVGMGVTSTGSLMPPVAAAGAVLLANAALMQSIEAMITPQPIEDVEVLLVQIAMQMRDTEVLSQTGKIKLDQTTRQAQAQERMNKLKEAQKQLDEARSKADSSNIFDRIKVALDVVVAIAQTVVAVAMIVTIAGAVQGSALAAAAGGAIVQASDSAMKMVTKDIGIGDGEGYGLAGMTALLGGMAAGADVESADFRKGVDAADMAFSMAVMVFTLAASIVSGVGAAKGVADAAQGAAKAGASAAKAGTEIAGKVTADVVREAIKATVSSFREGLSAAGNSSEMVLSGSAKAMKFSERAAGLSGSAAQVAQAGIEAGQSAVQYQAADLKSEGMRLDAEAREMGAVLAQLDDLIDQALQRLIGASDRFNNILDGLVETIQERGNANAAMQFRA